MSTYTLSVYKLVDLLTDCYEILVAIGSANKLDCHRLTLPKLWVVYLPITAIERIIPKLIRQVLRIVRRIDGEVFDWHDNRRVV